MLLLASSCAFIAGVFLGARFDIAAPALGMFAAASVLLIVLLRGTGRPSLPAWLALLLVLGALRVTLFEGDTSGLAVYQARGDVVLQGLVVGDPSTTKVGTRVRFAVDRVRVADGWVEQDGVVLVTLRPSLVLIAGRKSPYVRYGDRLQLEGDLRHPPELEGFDYPEYLARQGIGSVMSFPKVALVQEGRGNPLYRWLYTARSGIADSLVRSVPEPQAALGQAVLLGIREGLPDRTVAEFRATGTSHLLAISGLHVGVLLGLGVSASQWAVGRRRQLYLLAPLALVWVYALLAGMTPSVTRAAVMGSVYLAALALGRPRSILPALGFAAAFMVVLDPDALWSVSFQLSFAAMGGIAVIAPPLAQLIQRFYEDRSVLWSQLVPVLNVVSFVVSMTVGATIATLPLVAFYFERVSLVGIPATLLSLPALPFVLVMHAVAGLAGTIFAPVGELLGWLAWVPAAYLMGVVSLFSRLPGAYLDTGTIAPLLVWTYYALLLAWWMGSPHWRTAYEWLKKVVGVGPSLALHDRAIPVWALAPVVSVAAVLWIAAITLPDGRLHVAFLDVGQGDAALITTPNGRQIVVDGGPDPLGLVQELGRRVPFWDRTVDLVVLTHPHADHVGGMSEVLRRYKVGHIVERQVSYDSPDYLGWRQVVADEGAVLTEATSGQVIAFDDGLLIEVLNPPERLMRGTDSDIDNGSVVLRLVYKDVTFLLTGDLFRDGETGLVARGVPIGGAVLKVPHHGSRSSSSEGFLAAVSPAIAVISVGEDNGFGQPHAETLDAMHRHLAEDQVLLTSEVGTVEFVTDGRRLEVITER